MCHQKTCPTCSKITWGGCGNHADQVMRGVPQARRCTCTRPAGSTRRSFGSLFGR